MDVQTPQNIDHATCFALVLVTDGPANMCTSCLLEQKTVTAAAMPTALHEPETYDRKADHNPPHWTRPSASAVAPARYLENEEVQRGIELHRDVL